MAGTAGVVCFLLLVAGCFVCCKRLLKNKSKSRQYKRLSKQIVLGFKYGKRKSSYQSTDSRNVSSTGRPYIATKLTIQPQEAELNRIQMTSRRHSLSPAPSPRGPSPLPYGTSPTPPRRLSPPVTKLLIAREQSLNEEWHESEVLQPIAVSQTYSKAVSMPIVSHPSLSSETPSRQRSYSYDIEPKPEPTGRLLELLRGAQSLDDDFASSSSIPLLAFSASYNTKAKTFQVVIHSVQDIPEKYAPNCCAYVKLNFLPKSTQTFTTGVRKGDLHPVFNEPFRFYSVEAEDLDKCSLRFHVYAKELGKSKDTFLGEVFFLLSEVDWTDNLMTFSRPLNTQGRRKKVC